MSTTLYNTYFGSGGTGDIQIKNSSTLGYPDANFGTVLGPVYAPSIYGKDFSAFEIASSGKIAVTLYDKHVMDLDSSASSNVNFMAQDTWNLNFATSNVSVSLDESHHSFLVSAPLSNISLNAGSNFEVAAKDMSMYISNNMDLSSGNNMNIVGASNTNISATMGTVSLSASNSNVYIVLNSNQSPDIKMFAASNINSTACNDFIVSACNNVNLIAGHNTSVFSKDIITLSASNQGQGYSGITLDNTGNGGTDGGIYSVSYGNLSMATLDDDDSHINASIVIDAATDAINLTAEGKINLNSRFDTVIASSNNSSWSASNAIVSLCNGTLLANTFSNTVFSASQNFMVSALCNVSLGAKTVEVAANNSNMWFKLDAATNSSTLSTSSNISLVASNAASVVALSSVKLNTESNDVFVSLSNVSLTAYAKSNVSFLASNDVYIEAASNVFVDASTGSFAVTSSNSNVSFVLDAPTNSALLSTSSNITLTASNDTTVVSKSIKWSAASSNVIVSLCNETYGLDVYSASNTVFTASNTFTVNASSNIALGASNGSVFMSASNSNVTVALDAPTSSFRLFASNDIAARALQNIKVASSNNTFLVAAQSNVLVSMCNSDYSFNVFSTSNTNIVASNALALTSVQDMTMTSCNTVSLTGDASKLSVKLNASNNTIETTAFGSIESTASNDVVLTAQRHVIESAGSNLSLSASNNVAITASNNMTITSCNIKLDFVKDDGLTVTTACNFAVASSKNVVLDASSVTSLSLGANGNALLLASNDVTYSASNNVTALTKDGYIGLYAGGASSNAYFVLEKSGNATLRAGSNIRVESSNASITTSASNSSYMYAFNSNAYINIVENNGTSIQANASNYSFTAQGSNIMTMTSTDVTINGNLVIAGVVDSINVTNTILHVQDKEIILASASNNVEIHDGVANDSAGLVVQGFPQEYDPSMSNLFTKSLRWHKNSGGVPHVGTSNATSEAYWELMGGSMRLSTQQFTKNAGGQIIGSSGILSFALRINNTGELEIVKVVTTDSGTTMNRVAKFGRTL